MSMKVLLILLFAATVARSYAQQAAAQNHIGLRATHADSVEAIHHVFRTQRRFVRIGTLVMGAGVGYQIGLEASGQFQQTATKQTLAIAGNIINVGFLAAYVVNWVRFSKHREAQAIQRLDLHQPQPLYVQRWLVTYYSSNKRKR